MLSPRPLLVAFWAALFALTLTQCAVYASPSALSARLELKDVTLDNVEATHWWNFDLKDEWDKVVDFEDRATKFAESAFANATQEFKDSAAELDKIVEHLKSMVNDIGGFSDRLFQVHDVSPLDFSHELEKGLYRAGEALRNEFPPSETAPSHDERLKMVDAALESVGSVFITAGVDVGLPKDELEHWWSAIAAGLETIVVTSGDLIELHPALAETVLVAVVILVIPEIGWVERLLLDFFGFGRGGVVKGSLAAWAQRFFYGPKVNVGSLFSKLQRLGTGKGGGAWKHFVSWLGSFLP